MITFPGCENMQTQQFDPCATEDPLAEYRSGSTEPATVNILCALVFAIKPRQLLETGTYRALTTERLHFASPEGSTLTTIEHDTKRCQDAVRKCAEYPNILFHNDDAIDFLEAYIGPRFNFVFLDDDHEAQHVAAELDLLLQRNLVAPGGIICVHDVFGPFGLGPVVVARHGFLLDLPKLHAAGGLGVIQLPS